MNKSRTKMTSERIAENYTLWIGTVIFIYMYPKLGQIYRPGISQLKKAILKQLNLLV